jgi:hypothetical protein
MENKLISPIYNKVNHEVKIFLLNFHLTFFICQFYEQKDFRYHSIVCCHKVSLTIIDSLHYRWSVEPFLSTSLDFSSSYTIIMICPLLL